MKTLVGWKKVAVVMGMWLAMGCASKRQQQAPAQDARVIGATNEGVALNGDGAPCGPTRCAVGEVCCNESCGICTPEGGMCTQQFCEPQPAKDIANAPDGQGRKGQPGEGPCKQDADCRAVSDYCTGCDCRALGPKQELPACSGPGVRCLADPCMNRVAVCVQGYCQLKPPT